MAWYNKIDYPVDQIRKWIADGKTQAWIGAQLGVSAKLIQKVCKKHEITCQRRGPRSGEGHPDWKGGRVLDKSGYVLIYSPGHPRAKKPVPYVLEHRLVMEKHLGRLLAVGEVVHHRDGNKQNNSLDNLELFSKNSEHLRHELTGRVPGWSEDGKARIQQGIEKAAETHRRLGRDAREKRQSSYCQKELSGKDGQQAL